MTYNTLLTTDHAGFSPDLEEKLSAGIASGLLRDLHAVLVGRSGRVILERYEEGNDESWGRPLGFISFRSETLHDLRSVTKSIVGLLYGIALDRGLVPEPNAPLLAQFPEYADLAAHPERARLKVDHALTMTLGTEWDEQRPYTDPENSEIAMENAPDRYRFILERPLISEPGEKWIYSGGCVALIGALIERGTGKSLSEFACEALFEPLGISSFEWLAGKDGKESAASGLRLTARDLHRIGAMILNNGEWDSRRIISSAWLEDAFQPIVPTGDGLHYGRLWFVGNALTPALLGNRRWVAGFGNGGQRLWLMPEADVAVVTFSGNYNAWDAWITPTRVWSEIVLANLERT